ncbi:MAG: biotin/lipoyl-binding protein [Clostridium sp.]|nr:biotin/lipoyl-binding protein [Clostridium sp.]
MKTYKIKVNGKEYLVEVEEVLENAKTSPKDTEKSETKSNNSNVEEIDAPMQGTLLSVEVDEGENVVKGQLIAVLEAMKLENEIVSPFDGVIEEILVKNGETVDNGTRLMTVLSR